MKVETMIHELTSQIAACQDVIKALHRLAGNGDPANAADISPGKATNCRNKGRGRKLTRPGGYKTSRIQPPERIAETRNATVVLELDRPTTMGGAMKTIIWAKTGPFTGEELRNEMLADKGYAQLFEVAGPGAFSANLKYWAKQGYLKMKGETPLEATFTVVDREWFA
jgi:hypothetical protein